MTIETIEVKSEIVAPVDAQLVKYAGETGLEKPATETLVEAFRPIFIKAREAIASSNGVAESVKDATCVKEIRKSRACRLALRAVRLESDETRKKHKQHALLYGRAVDGFHNILLADLSPVETRLQEAEDIAERAEAARLSALKTAREAELGPLLETPILGDLSEISESEYQKILADAKLLKQAKLDAIAKTEADRKAKEEADRIEREHISSENERLKSEALEKERLAEIERKRIEAERAEERRKAKEQSDAALAKAKAESDKKAEIAAKERKRIEAKAKADSEAAAKAFAELAAKAKAEADNVARVEAERRAAAAAPDKAKLKAFAAELRRLTVPELKSTQVLGLLPGKIEELAAWVEAQISRL